MRQRQLTYDEKRMELTEHLGELRTRLMRAILYLVVGAVVAYQLFSPLYALLYRPLASEMKRQNSLLVMPGVSMEPLPHARAGYVDAAQYNGLIDVVNALRERPLAAPPMSIVFRGFQEPFLVRLKISIIYGFILVVPLVIFELAAFITPALTPQERRPMRLLMPVSVLLLISGVLVAYFTMFYAMHWFLSYLADFPQPAVLMQDPNDYIIFFVKMMAAFALAFQLPVVLMGLAFAGLVTSKGLIKHWRWGVIIAALGGLFTPSNDLFSMALMAIPLLLLYGASIFLVRIVERMRAKKPG